ncbi:hypothetical protein SAMN02745126_02389 [Enhydrobacter aerosaccus]|uniref:Uncharacterized protein n=1 Tax=Enhydrobacter aerosaccus TaxID=225324 RepID=A0A1T4NPN7_9HYPH|nr:hypothetical protein SAMN02745126_02389 [Enhydrobacter aerosaccus]
MSRGSDVLFLRALDVAPNVEALSQLVRHLAPYRIMALDLDRDAPQKDDEGWLNATLEVLNTALLTMLPFVVLAILLNLSQNGFRLKTVSSLIIAVLMGVKIYKRISRSEVSRQRLGGGSDLTLCVSQQALEEERERLGWGCGFAVIDLSRKADPSDGEIAYLEKTKPGCTIVLLPESALVPMEVQRLGAPVVRYGEGAPDLADQLRSVLGSLAAAGSVEIGKGPRKRQVLP